MSGRSSRRRGADWERQIAAWLREHGVPAERTSRGVHQHAGDIDGLPALHIEAKNQRTLDLAGWVDQAVADAAPGRLPLLVVKRRGVADVGRAYAVTELGLLLHHLDAILIDPTTDRDDRRPGERTKGAPA